MSSRFFTGLDSDLVSIQVHLRPWLLHVPVRLVHSLLLWDLV